MASIPPQVTFPIQEYAPYYPRDTLAMTKKYFFLGSGLGGISHVFYEYMIERRTPKFTSAFVRTLSKVTLTSGAISANYIFVLCAMSNLRKTEDATNAAVTGAVTGAITGVLFKPRTIPRVAGYATLGAVFLGLYTWAGKQSLQWAPTTVDGEFDLDRANADATSGQSLNQHGLYKGGLWQVSYRRPLSQTVEELGEGRGIFNPEK
ncbi:uncharacterized protein V1510DRAFT_421244 [Dipodascopsis tothii]|uniref:uncharacterized protein n=1 Tax=Dipodascopsis tothii TaxID=44089 RepID=UPI0034CD77C9